MHFVYSGAFSTSITGHFADDMASIWRNIKNKAKYINYILLQCRIDLFFINIFLFNPFMCELWIILDSDLISNWRKLQWDMKILIRIARSCIKTDYNITIYISYNNTWYESVNVLTGKTWYTAEMCCIYRNCIFPGVLAVTPWRPRSIPWLVTSDAPPPVKLSSADINTLYTCEHMQRRVFCSVIKWLQGQI